MTFEEILPHVDHTLLAATATKGEIEKLCEEAEMYHTASVCVPSSFVKEIRERHPGLRICAVAGFPLGNMSKAAKVFESRQAVLDGADEIDIVLHIGALKDGNAEYVTDEIAAVKEAIGDHVLKVIIESGALKTPELIRRASLLSMFAGADFVKTSTGKIDVAATPEAAVVMCQAIRDYYEKTGRKVGFKAAGGVRTPEDAALYYTIVEEILGREWLTTDLFRIGASSAANNLLSAIEGKPVKYY